MKKLEKLADVLVGQIMTRVASRDGEGHDVKVMVPGAVDQGYVVESSLGTNNVIKDIDSRYVTKEGDIVMKLTSDYDAALINKDQEGIIISSFIAVIRSKDIDPGYLCAVLNSEYVKLILRSKAEGAIRPMLKISDIRGLSIPELNKEEQENIGKAYDLSIQKELLLRELIENEKNIMKAVVNNSIMEEIKHE